MASLNEHGMGIGDFAEMLFEQEAVTNPVPKKSKPSMNKGGAYVPDIEDVEVLQEDVDNVLSNSFGVSIPKKESASPVKVDLLEERRLLKEEISQTVSKLKNLLVKYESLKEATTTGMIAPFIGGKRGPKRNNRKLNRK